MSHTTITLRQYTGCYIREDRSERVVIVLDKNTLKLCYLHAITGAIASTSILSPDAATLRAMKDATGGAELHTTWRKKPHQKVSFDIGGGEVHGFETSEQKYKRIEAGEDRFSQLPVEVRQMIWKYALTTGHGTIGMFRQENGNVVICGGRSWDQKTPVNRIFEVCKAFKIEHMFMELFYNHLYLDFTGSNVLMKVLRACKPVLKETKRQVTFMTKWQKYDAPPQLLYDLLEHGKENPNGTINIVVWNWNFRRMKPDDIRDFIQFSCDLCYAIRGGDNGDKARWSLVAKMWRGGKELADVDVPNVRFFPARKVEGNDEDVMSEGEWNKVKAACGVKAFKDYLRGYDPFSKSDALDKLVVDVKDYHNNGI